MTDEEKKKIWGQIARILVSALAAAGIAFIQSLHSAAAQCIPVTTVAEHSALYAVVIKGTWTLIRNA